MIGKKERTLPTPAHTPSMMSETSHGVTCIPVRVAESQAVNWSIQAPSRSCSGAPMTEKVSQKMTSMMSRKTGMPRYLLVSTWSIFSERSCSRVS